MLETPERIRTLQRKLYCNAKQEKSFRFYALYDKVYRADILSHAWRLVRANGGGPGIDGVTFAAIEAGEGESAWLAELEQALKEKTYRASPVKRVMIPKGDGTERPLGIPTIRDRVAQMAVKLVIEPIFEADFCSTSYGFRPKRSAHDAVDDVSYTLNQGYAEVIDADLSRYFDTIPHARLMAAVAERICDSAILHLLQMWLKAAVVVEEKDGTRRHEGGGKGNRKGTPQGGAISPLYARFDEGGAGWRAMMRLVRHRQTKGAETNRPHLKPLQTAPYSTRGKRWFVQHLQARPHDATRSECLPAGRQGAVEQDDRPSPFFNLFLGRTTRGGQI